MNVSFYFWTSLRECMGSQVGAEAEIELNEEEAKLLQSAFGDQEEVDAELVENTVGEPLWQRLRKAMDEAIYLDMAQNALYEAGGEFEEQWNESHDTLWEDLPEEEQLAFVQESADPDFKPDWDICALANLDID